MLKKSLLQYYYYYYEAVRFHYESFISSSLQPGTNVLTPGFNLASAAGRVTGGTSTRNLPDLRFFPGGVESDSLRAGRRLPPLCDWCNFETPPPGAAPRPSEAGLGDYAKYLRPAPRPDWRPLFAAQLQETTPRCGGQQVRSGEGLAVGPGRVLAPRWVSVSPSRGMGREGEQRRWAWAHGDGADLGLSHVETIAALGVGGSPGEAMHSESTPGSLHLPASVSTSAQWGRWLFLTACGWRGSKGGEGSPGNLEVVLGPAEGCVWVRGVAG